MFKQMIYPIRWLINTQESINHLVWLLTTFLNIIYEKKTNPYRNHLLPINFAYVHLQTIYSKVNRTNCDVKFAF